MWRDERRDDGIPTSASEEDRAEGDNVRPGGEEDTAEHGTDNSTVENWK